MDSKIWKPLISDPELLKEYSKSLGVLSDICFHDIYSIEEWVFETNPKDPISIILIFNTNKEIIEEREQKSIAVGCSNSNQQDIWFMKQFVPNSCGTVALLHSILNNKEIKVKKGSFLEEIFNIKSDKKDLPELRGNHLKEDIHIENLHKEITSRDSCKDSNKVSEVDFHYVAFIIHEDNLFELDGRLLGPIDHGICQKKDFLKNTIQVIRKEFIVPSGENADIAILALYLKK